MVLQKERKPLSRICSGKDCCARGHSSKGTTTDSEMWRQEGPRANSVWLIRWQPGSWALVTVLKRAAATFTLKLQNKDRCLNMSPKRCSFSMSIWALGEIPDTLVSERLERNAQGPLAGWVLHPQEPQQTPALSITSHTYKFQDIPVNCSCIRYMGGRTKVSQIPGGRNFPIFPVMTLFRINSVPQKCYVFCA